jgi:hypothetical protein
VFVCVLAWLLFERYVVLCSNKAALLLSAACLMTSVMDLTAMVPQNIHNRKLRKAFCTVKVVYEAYRAARETGCVPRALQLGDPTFLLSAKNRQRL